MVNIFWSTREEQIMNKAKWTNKFYKLKNKMLWEKMYISYVWKIKYNNFNSKSNFDILRSKLLYNLIYNFE